MDGIEELIGADGSCWRSVEADPRSDCWRQFDNLFYEPVFSICVQSSPSSAPAFARYLDKQGSLSARSSWRRSARRCFTTPRKLIAFVRENAWKFDPERGSSTLWVLGAAESAYVDVAKAIVKARRSEKLSFVDPLAWRLRGCQVDRGARAAPPRRRRCACANSLASRTRPVDGAPLPITVTTAVSRHRASDVPR